VGGSVGVGSFVNRVRRRAEKPSRWGSNPPRTGKKPELVQIAT
jgi:hypothetical protein